MHPSERALAFRELVRTPVPDSLEEKDALAAIDARRFEEINPPTRRQQRRALRAYWGDRSHALEG